MAQLNSGYSSSEVMAMQRDAVDRVRDMQRRAQEKLQQTGGIVPTASPPIRRPPEVAEQKVPPPMASPPQVSTHLHHSGQKNQNIPSHSSANGKPQDFLGGLLGSFGLDSERIFLLILIYLLAKEGSDQMLVLALLYLLI